VEVSAVVEVTGADAVRGHAFAGSVPEFPGMDADVALPAVLDPVALIESVPGVEVSSLTYEIRLEPDPDFAQLFPATTPADG
jgi:hypothetical protein